MGWGSLFQALIDAVGTLSDPITGNELDAENPPCPDCQYWKPQKLYRYKDGEGMVEDGFVLCVSRPKNDFTCYTESSS